jgi:hypothetical protein
VESADTTDLKSVALNEHPGSTPGRPKKFGPRVGSMSPADEVRSNPWEAYALNAGDANRLSPPRKSEASAAGGGFGCRYQYVNGSIPLYLYPIT